MHLNLLPGNEKYIVIAIIVLVVLVFRGSQLFTSRSKAHLNTPLGEARSYSIAGGAICPKCQRPFAISLLSLKLGFAKFTPCPYCGKWSLVQRASQEELRAAEAAERGPVQTTQPKDEAAKLKEMVDESRFTDKS